VLFGSHRMMSSNMNIIWFILVEKEKSKHKNGTEKKTIRSLDANVSS
jgi:hypothetical protein